jgi:predicted amidophosphoribosyltransferase
MKKRYYRSPYCEKCNRQVSVINEICPHCGGSINPFHTVCEMWYPLKVIWWNPLTWLGGKWIEIED